MHVNRLVIVSNRLPISVQSNGNEEWHIAPSSGGLVTALNSALRNRGDMWIGWHGAPGLSNAGELLENVSQEVGYTLKSVPLSRCDIENYYYGFSNEVLWPLFHDLLYPCKFEPHYWNAYQTVNRKFARAVAAEIEPDDFLWIHDYHLTLVGRELREMGHQTPMGYFLHIPFPSVDIFMRLPWRREILEGLLDFDFIGLQTQRDTRNFIQCAHMLLGDVDIEQNGNLVRLYHPRGRSRIGAFPISIDYDDFVERASHPEVEHYMCKMKERFRSQKLVLSVDRLDYSKGILHHLHAYADTLERYPDLRERLTFYQVLVPSRTHVEAYQELKREIDRTVGEINGKYNQNGWLPIHYDYRSLDPHELLAAYRYSDIALVTPIKDGMNLVAKEYCTCSLNDDGVLILSEFAGVAAELHEHALMINPFDKEGVSQALYDAYFMEPSVRRKRMKHLRKTVRKHDIFAWLQGFLEGVQRTTTEPTPDLLPNGGQASWSQPTHL